MSYTLAACRPADLDRLRAVVAHPSLHGEYAWLIASGELRDPLSHPHVAPGGLRLALDRDRPVAFCMMMLWPSARGPWSMIRLGVVDEHRRKGVGRALLAAAEQRLSELEPGRRPREVCLSAWQPNPAATAFASTHGYAPARFFWSMERPRGRTNAEVWPDGIQVRTFDGSESALRDWNDCYNESFAESFLTMSSTIEDCRRLARLESFRDSGLLLAYRDGACVGFCRNALYPDFGEIDVLGVVPAARGLGLGRALLRWGVGWLQEQKAPHVRLMVDAENDTALRLYRAEGFETIRTRQAWSRRPEASGRPTSAR